MVRDWEIVKEILLRLESGEKPNWQVNAKDFPSFDEQAVAYNMRLLDDAGYIEGRFLNNSDGSGTIALAIALRLTNAGHDLLDTVRNATVWGKIKDKFAKNGLDMTFDLVIKVGKEIIDSLLT